MADRDLHGRTLGDFVLLELLGEGGCGAVWRCVQPSLKREVVVKVLHERRQRSHLAQERFLREAHLASRLDHPYAVHIYDFGVEQDDGLRWIAMELVHGITLDEWLREHGPMPLAALVPFFECVAQVVQVAHERGIVHRDLKPSNVMVIARGGHLLPKLLDFGIAKMDHDAPEDPARVADEEVTPRMRSAPPRVERTRTDPRPDGHPLTRSGIGIGSYPYMSPEQWKDASAVGPAADIYALGALVYKALTGRVPFTADSVLEYYQHHAFSKVPPLGGAFPAELDRVLRCALAKTPDARHGTALELAAALRAALRASAPELLRSSAQQWDAKGRAPGLLWGGDVLADVERWRRRAPSGELGELECSFLQGSHRRARRLAWIRRSLVALAAVSVVGAVQYRAAMQTRLAQQQTRSAQQMAEATVTQAELEQGRAALLHGEPEAQRHLTEAYRRDRSPSTAFMLARALQPRLAEQARFASSSGRMWSAAFSPDGTQIVTTDDKNAQVWDAQTHRLRFTLPHGDTVYQAVYSNDGTRIITAGGDGSVRIWDAADGALVRALTHDRKRPRYGAVAALPDGKLVAAIDIKGEVAHVWDTTTGALLAELPNDAKDFFSLAFSADGRWLATGGGDDVRVFDVRTWARVRTLEGQRRLSWDPTGPRLLTGSADGDVSIWAIPAGSRLRHLREIGEPVNRVAFSPNGALVVAASEDGAEQVWDAASGKLRSQANYLHGKILSVEFDRTSTLVVAAGASGAVAVADPVLGMPVAVLDGPRNVVMAAHFDPSARRIIGASWDGTARIWDATAPYRRWSSPPVTDDCGLVTSLEPDRRVVAIGCRDHPTRVWDTARGQLLAELPSVTHVDGGGFASAYPAVSAAGDRAAIARGNTVEVYELPGGQLLHKIAHGAPVNTVAFATTGRDIVSGAVDGSLLVTRDSGALVVLPTSPGGIDAAGFLPDGRVVAADAQRRLRVYDPGGAALANLQTVGRVGTLRMSLDGRRLITVPSVMNAAASPELWDLEHYRRVAQLDDQAQGPVYSARFVAGGQILTACSDGAARRWDGTTGQLRQTYRGGSRLLLDAILSSDGSMVVAGSGEGLLRFWDASSGRQLWTMPAHRSLVVGIRVEGDGIVTRGSSGDISRWTLPNPARVIEACGDHERCGIVAK